MNKSIAYLLHKNGWLNGEDVDLVERTVKKKAKRVTLDEKIPMFGPYSKKESVYS